MPSIGRAIFSSLGGFSPVNRLTGKAKRPGETPSSSSPTHMQAPPPKRRRTDEHDDDVAVVQSVQVAAADRGHHQQQHLRKKPSEASIDILIQSSPDLSLYERPRSRSRSRSVCVLSGSQQGGGNGSRSNSNSNNNNNLMNQDEMRLVEKGSVGTPHRRRRRKHRNGGFGMSQGGGIGRPVNLQSPSPDPEELFVIEDDASPIKPAFGPPKPNTNLSIDLSSSNGSAKGRFRNRMNESSSNNQGDMAPPQRKNGIYSNKTHSESVDELSEEYFPDPSAKRQQMQISRNPVVHLGEAPARAAGAAAEKRRQLQLLEKREHERELQKKKEQQQQQQQSPKTSDTIPMMVEAIVDSPLQVKVAFRQPSTFFMADQDANIPTFSLTINPPFNEVLVPVDGARARSEKLHWLKFDLFHVRNVSFNVDSPIVFITLPQGDGMGALMGLQFDSVDDVRRFASWATGSPMSRSFQVGQKSSSIQLKRKFDRCLAEVQDHKEFKDKKDKDHKDAKESTPAKVGSDKGSARSSPAVNTEYMSFRRTRSSRNLNGGGGATETIDLDGNDTKSSSLFGSSPTTTTTSSDVVATTGGDRASRLRNRAARLPPSRPLLQDMEFERWTLKNPDWARDWRVPLTYSRTTVDKDDVARLDEGEFLNDNIINFYIQFLQDSLKMGDSPVSKRVYFHNTFFYEKLRPRKGQKISFDGVKRWTAKVDLFGYDYIIIPVNEHAHWWLAIICNVPKILDKSLPESMKEKTVPEVVVEELEAIKDREVSKSSDKSSVAPVDVDAHADAHADDVKETGVYQFVPIDVDGPKPRPRSVVIDDEEEKTPKQASSSSTSPPRADGQRKDTPIDVDGSEAKTDDKHSHPIVLDSVEKDDSQVQAEAQAQGAANSKDSSPKPASTSKSNSVEVSGSNNDGNDDEVTEIQSDLVASASSSSSAPAAKKPFRGGGAALNSKKVFIAPGTKKDPKDPRIFTLDSLGSVHTASVDHLKQWMMAEIAERKGVKPEDPGRLGMTAKAIPQQENFCDCGVYLLLYIREFVKDPDGFIEDIVLRQERNWDTSAPDMRKQLRDLILHMQKEYQKGEDAKKKKKKQAASGATVGGAAAKRPTPAASLAPVTAAATTTTADVPIPSSETMDQQITAQSVQHAPNTQNDNSPTSSSPISLEAGDSSPFLQHGSKSPNVFDEHKPHP